MGEIFLVDGIEQLASAAISGISGSERCEWLAIVEKNVYPQRSGPRFWRRVPRVCSCVAERLERVPCPAGVPGEQKIDGRVQESRVAPAVSRHGPGIPEMDGGLEGENVGCREQGVAREKESLKIHLSATELTARHHVDGLSSFERQREQTTR